MSPTPTPPAGDPAADEEVLAEVRELVEQFGDQVVADPQLLKSLLYDTLPGRHAEINQTLEHLVGHPDAWQEHRHPRHAEVAEQGRTEPDEATSPTHPQREPGVPDPTGGEGERQRRQPPQRRRWVVAVLGAVVVLVVGGVALFSASDPTDRAETTTSPPTVSADDQLLARVPPAAGDCTSEPTHFGIAKVACETSFTTSAGESLDVSSRFTLYADAASMDTYFKDMVADVTSAGGTCPRAGTISSYTFTTDPDEPQGRVACYFNGAFPR